MKESFWVACIIVFDALILLFDVHELSISYKEAFSYFEQTSPLHYIIHSSCYIFGQNNFGLKIPFIFMHLVSVLLLYDIGKDFLKFPIDRIMSVLVFVLLPAVNASAIVANEAGLVIFFTLLFIWFWKNGFLKASYVLLILTLFVDNSFSILYLTLFFYALAKKKNLLIILCLTLFSISMYAYGFDTRGRPRGHFLDTLGVYAAAFSPLVFFYYVYTLYRIMIKEEKHILWFISFGALVLSLLLSFRQKLILEDFLPFAVISTPLMVKMFLNSYRIRLPKFRRFHRVMFAFMLGSMALIFILSTANKFLYTFYKNPKKHFAYKYQVAKELSDWLKKNNIKNIYVNDKKLRLRLKFYGIHSSDKIQLKKAKISDKGDKIFELKYASNHIISYKIVLKDLK